MAEWVQVDAQAWLETRSHPVQVWFAARCALRELPGLGFERGPAIDLLSLASFRATIIAAAAATCREFQMKDLETTARAVSAAAFSFATANGHAKHAKNAIMACYSASLAAASVYSTYFDRYPTELSAYLALTASH